MRRAIGILLCLGVAAILVVASGDDTEVRSYELGQTLQGVEIVNGMLYALDWETGLIYGIDLAAGTYWELDTGLLHVNDLASDGERLWLVDEAGTAKTVNLASHALSEESLPVSLNGEVLGTEYMSDALYLLVYQFDGPKLCEIPDDGPVEWFRIVGDESAGELIGLQETGPGVDGFMLTLDYASHTLYRVTQVGGSMVLSEYADVWDFVDPDVAGGKIAGFFFDDEGRAFFTSPAESGRLYVVSPPDSGFPVLVDPVSERQEEKTDSESSSLDWKMVLTEPGLTRYVLRCRFPEDSDDLVGLQFEQLNASSYDGIEFEAKADRLSSVRVWIACSDQTSSESFDPAQEEWLSASSLVALDPYATVTRLTFDQFRISAGTTSSGSSINPALNPAMIRGIYFEPLSEEVGLEIGYLALYRKGSTEAAVTQLMIDQFSLWSADKPGEWVVGSRSATVSSWEPIPETLLTTDAWQWTGIHQQGGTLDVISDPTVSGRGLVGRVSVPPLFDNGRMLASSGPRIERWDGIYVSRIYGGVYFPHHAPPCVTSIDVFLDHELVSTAAESTSGTILLDVYDRCVDPSASGCWENLHGEPNNASLQAKLWIGSRVDDEVYLSLKYGSYAYAVALLAEGAPAFTPNEWHTISIVVHSDRTAELYQDGVLVAWHSLSQEMVGGTTGGHPGLYIHDSISRGRYAVRGVFLYDNYRIQCGEDLDIAAIIAEQTK